MTPAKTPKTASVLHLKLDPDILGGLAALAEKETKANGYPVTQAALIRKAIKALLDGRVSEPKR